MARSLIKEFHWRGESANMNDGMSDQEKYQELINWARKARSKNPNVFDKLTEWLLDDAEWSSDRIS